MGWIAAAAAVASTVISAQGQAEAGDAAEAQGRERKAASDYAAAQMRVNAGQAEAQGQIQSLDEIRKSQLIQSRALAVAAASGGGATDPTVLNIISGIAKEGELARLTDIYNGNERGRAMRNQAKTTDYEGAQYEYAGKLAKRSSDFAVASTVFKGASAAFGSMSGGGGGSGIGTADNMAMGSTSSYGLSG